MNFRRSNSQSHQYFDLKGRIPFCFDELRTFLNSFECIQSQKLNGGAAFRSLATDLCADEFKVVVPILRARIKQRDEVTRFGIEGRNVTGLSKIAGRTTQCEVVEICITSVFFSDDMIDLMRRGDEVLMQQAVFAAVLSAFHNRLTH